MKSVEKTEGMIMGEAHGVRMMQTLATSFWGIKLPVTQYKLDFKKKKTLQIQKQSVDSLHGGINLARFDMVDEW